MFNSNVLEVGVGLVFTFLAISLITGAVIETITSATKWRANTLLSGIKTLLNDANFDGLARKVYEHAAVNPHGTPAAPVENLPSYIEKSQFANALMDITGISGAAAAAPPTAAVAALTAAVNARIAPAPVPAAAPATNPQIAQLLQGIIDRNLGDKDKVKAEIEAWFDNAMDRLSGVYKRWMQFLSVLIALVLAVIINADALTIAKKVWEHPTLAEKLKPNDKVPTPQAALETLDKNLPVGWPEGFLYVRNFDKPKKDASGSAMKDANGDPTYDADWFFNTKQLPTIILGWLITAIATLFGAPFWFDTLQKIVRLKGAGPSPEEKKKNEAAPS
jgi:hypothetical protein